MKKRLTVVLMAVMLIVGFLPFKASANSAPPPPFYVINLTNLPEEAVYADLLIPLRETDENYVALNRDQLPDGFSENAEIINYSADGYCSYTFHYKDAVSSISVNEEGKVCFFADTQFVKEWNGEANQKHQYDIPGLGYIRIALLDRSGNVLDVSPVLAIHDKGPFTSVEHRFFYDAAVRDIHVEFETSSFGACLYLIIAFAGMVFTCITEMVAAFPFGLDKRYSGKILLTNACSQILMHAAYLGLYGVIFWKYKYVVIMLEVLVYAGEYLWYSRKMRDISKKKILAYTVTANTISLVVGMCTTYSLIL